MPSLLQDLNLHWTADLSVGSAQLDARNQRMFGRLAQAEDVLAESDDQDAFRRRRRLAVWFADTLVLLEDLLEAEERELAAAGYPELAFHRQLHAPVRARMRELRGSLAQTTGLHDLQQIQEMVQETCAELAVWLMRHVQDADRLFRPYVDTRFRIAGR